MFQAKNMMIRGLLGAKIKEIVEALNITNENKEFIGILEEIATGITSHTNETKAVLKVLFETIVFTSQ